MPHSSQVPEPWKSFLGELDREATAETRLDCMGGFVATLLYGYAEQHVEVEVAAVIRRAAWPQIPPMQSKPSPQLASRSSSRERFPWFRHLARVWHEEDSPPACRQQIPSAAVAGRFVRSHFLSASVRASVAKSILLDKPRSFQHLRVFPEPSRTVRVG